MKYYHPTATCMLHEDGSPKININLELFMAVANDAADALREYQMNYGTTPLYNQYYTLSGKVSDICEICGFDFEKVMAMSRLYNRYMKKHNYEDRLDVSNRTQATRWLQYVMVNPQERDREEHMKVTHRLISSWGAKNRVEKLVKEKELIDGLIVGICYNNFSEDADERIDSFSRSEVLVLMNAITNHPIVEREVGPELVVCTYRTPYGDVRVTRNGYTGAVVSIVKVSEKTMVFNWSGYLVDFNEAVKQMDNDVLCMCDTDENSDPQVFFTEYERRHVFDMGKARRDNDMWELSEPFASTQKKGDRK